MATDNTDTSVIWAPGDATGHNPGGATADIPDSKFVVPTFTATGSTPPTGNLVKFVNDDIYYFDADEWVGPYVLAT